MYFYENELYHIYNRGNNREQLFYEDEDYIAFLRLLRTRISPHCDLLTWCLMPSHFHLMIHATHATCTERPAFGGKPMQVLPYRIGVLLSTYAQHLNKKMERTGSLFQQKTKSISVTDEMQRSAFSGSKQDYVVNLMHYHHQNPVRANLVVKMEDWKYSSFVDYCGFRSGSLCNRQLLFDITGYNRTGFYEYSYLALQNRTN